MDGVDPWVDGWMDWMGRMRGWMGLGWLALCELRDGRASERRTQWMDEWLGCMRLCDLLIHCCLSASVGQLARSITCRIWKGLSLSLLASSLSYLVGGE